MKNTIFIAVYCTWTGMILNHQANKVSECEAKLAEAQEKIEDLERQKKTMREFYLDELNARMKEK